MSFVLTILMKIINCDTRIDMKPGFIIKMIENIEYSQLF